MSDITLREALLCAMAQATDERGLRLRSPELPVAIAVARAIEKHLGAYGYKIVPISYEAPPFNVSSSSSEPPVTTLAELEAWFKRSFDVRPAPTDSGGYAWDANKREAHVGQRRRYVVISRSVQTTREQLDDSNVAIAAHLEARLAAEMWAQLEQLRLKAWSAVNNLLVAKPTAVVRRWFTVDHGSPHDMDPKVSFTLRVDFPDLPETWGGEVGA